MCNIPLLENNSQFSVIILAAGYSSRMCGALKALLPLGRFSCLLQMLIERFRVAGIDDIHIVLGHEQKSIMETISDLDCCLVYNPDFDKGMFSSICAGIESVLNKGTSQKASFILPVDAALIKSDTLQTMMSLWKNKNKLDDVFIPYFLKQCGHPPLVGRDHFSKILQYYQDSQNQEKLALYASQGLEFLHGLRGYFASYLDSEARALFIKGYAEEQLSDVGKCSDTDNFRKCSNIKQLSDAGKSSGTGQFSGGRYSDVEKIPTSRKFSNTEKLSCSKKTTEIKQSSKVIHFVSIADEGILSDIDTLDDYKNAQTFLQLTQNRQTASLQESWHLLQGACLPERIAKHSYKVALGALRLGLALQREGVNPLYHVCGGLLHDICRLQKNHAFAGDTYLRQHGWNELAYIVGSHTALGKNILEAMNIHLEEPLEHIGKLPFESDLHNNSNCLFASICVYLADKFYAGEDFVSLEKRFLNVKERYAQFPDSLKAIDVRKQVAIAVCDWFYSVSKIHAEECVEITSTHELENELKILYKNSYL